MLPSIDLLPDNQLSLNELYAINRYIRNLYLVRIGFMRIMISFTAIIDRYSIFQNFQMQSDRHPSIFCLQCMVRKPTYHQSISFQGNCSKYTDSHSYDSQQTGFHSTASLQTCLQSQSDPHCYNSFPCKFESGKFL